MELIPELDGPPDPRRADLLTFVVVAGLGVESGLVDGDDGHEVGPVLQEVAGDRRTRMTDVLRLDRNRGLGDGRSLAERRQGPEELQDGNASEGRDSLRSPVREHRGPSSSGRWPSRIADGSEQEASEESRALLAKSPDSPGRAGRRQCASAGDSRLRGIGVRHRNSGGCLQRPLVAADLAHQEQRHRSEDAHVVEPAQRPGWCRESGRTARPRRRPLLLRPASSRWPRPGRGGSARAFAASRPSEPGHPPGAPRRRAPRTSAPTAS